MPRTWPRTGAELARAVIDEGGSVHHIEADDRLTEHVVAAELRFPLPPLP